MAQSVIAFDEMGTHKLFMFSLVFNTCDGNNERRGTCTDVVDVDDAQIRDGVILGLLVAKEQCRVTILNELVQQQQRWTRPTHCN